MLEESIEYNVYYYNKCKRHDRNTSDSFSTYVFFQFICIERQYAKE